MRVTTFYKRDRLIISAPLRATGTKHSPTRSFVTNQKSTRQYNSEKVYTVCDQFFVAYAQKWRYFYFRSEI